MSGRSTGRRPRRSSRGSPIRHRRPQLPDPAVLRRHAPAHVVLDGCGRLRCPADAAGRLPLRQGRGGHGLERPAGQARRARSISSSSPITRTTWASSRNCSPASPRCSPIRRAGRWYDMIQSGKGAEAAHRDHRQLLAGHVPEGNLLTCPARRPTVRPGRRPSRRRTRRTTRAGSPPSSATSGPRTPAATTCTATSSSATTATKASLVEPFTTIKPLGSDNPRDLWKWMAAYEEKTGGNVLAIAHNGNLSNGRMFPIIESFTGKPIDREYAETRARWERLYEATQIKGDGETHPFLSPNDEFANFERWDKGNLDLSEAKKPEMLPVRVCPLGAEDRPQAGAGARRQSLQVRHDRLDRRPHRAGHRRGGQFLRQDLRHGTEPGTRSARPSSKTEKATIMDWEASASGYAAVWATREHARGALRRDAARARPTPPPGRAWSCASSAAGTSRRRMRRPAARPWSATRRACRWAATSATRPPGKAPTFLVAALKDPIGANLDRIQIVKGWLDKRRQAAGEGLRRGLGRGDRKPGRADGKLPPVGNTVDVANATWTNTIGAPELITVWTRPGLRPDAARLLLRARARDPDAALDGLRREVLRRPSAARGAA